MSEGDSKASPGQRGEDPKPTPAPEPKPQPAPEPAPKPSKPATPPTILTEGEKPGRNTFKDRK